MLEKIGFIGFGNMAVAIAQGACNSGYIKPDQIYIYDCFDEKNQLATKYGYHPLQNEADVSKVCDAIFLTVKPQVYPVVLKAIRSFITPEKCLVSVAAGKSIRYVKERIGFDCKVIRIMPNTPLLLGYGACGISAHPPVTKAEFNAVENILQSCATTVVVKEESLDAVTAVSGSAPAYLFAFARAVIRKGIKAGLTKEAATRLFTATLIGSAKMIESSGMECDALIKMVASPGGTTEAALKSLNDGNFEPLVEQAMQACIDRAKELSVSE